jgi:hypothetical protein
LILTTSDYALTGAGWIALDRNTRWNGQFVLSPRLTQEVQRDNRWLRYVLDRRAQLTIPFRVEGTVPDVRIRLENRLMAQALRGGAPARDDERSRSSDGRGKDAKGWLPDALDRILNR